MSKIILENTSLIIGEKIGKSDSLFYNFPSMEILSTGEWLVCSREIKGLTDPKGRIRHRRSADAGKTWIEETPPTCHDEKDYPGNGFLMCHITELSPNELLAVYMMIFTDETQPLFHPATDGMQKTKVRITKSFDNGHTWSKPKDIEYESPDLIVTSKPVKFPDGSVGIPCEMHDEWEKGYQEPLAAIIIKSYDRGYTFPKRITIASDPAMLYGDARPAFDGKELSIYFWSYNVAENKDTFIHRAKSKDYGETWSAIQPINLKMQITSPLYLRENLMVCACQDRFSENPGIKALLSRDGGMNWDKESELTIFGANSRPDGNNPFGQFTQFKFGYSTIHKLSGSQFAILYWHDNSASTSISVSTARIAD